MHVCICVNTFYTSLYIWYAYCLLVACLYANCIQVVYILFTCYAHVFVCMLYAYMSRDTCYMYVVGILFYVCWQYLLSVCGMYVATHLICNIIYGDICMHVLCMLHGYSLCIFYAGCILVVCMFA